MEIYAFYGREADDLVYYLSILMRQMGFRINIFDGTQNGVLFQASFPQKQEGEACNIAGICISRACSQPPYFTQEQKELERSYDYIFYLSERPRRKLRVNRAFFVSDIRKANVERLEGGYKEHGEDSVVVLRNCVKTIMDDEIFFRLHAPDWAIRENICGIDYDDMDHILSIQLEYELPKKIPSLSKSYEHILCSLAELITKEEKKQIRKAYRMGRRV